MTTGILKNIYLFYLFWLRRGLVAARGIFVVACGIFLVAACRFLVVACMWDLVPPPGIERGPPALGLWSLTPGTTREIPWDLL